MSRRSPSDSLAASLEIALAGHFGELVGLMHKWSDWHSATFAGARHELQFSVAPDQIDKLDMIGEDDLPLRRGFVADLVVAGHLSRPDHVAIKLEVLTLLD